MKDSKGKIILVILIIFFGILYATPNLFLDRPVVQLSPIQDEGKDFSEVKNRLEILLEQQQIAHEFIEGNGKLFVMLDDSPAQTRVLALASENFSDQYYTALSMMPNIPTWLTALGYKPLTKGLDLRGGVHLLLQVDTAELLNKQAESNLDTILELLGENKIAYHDLKNIDGAGVQVMLASADTRIALENLVSKSLPDLQLQAGVDSQTVRYLLPQAKLDELKSRAIEQNTITLRERMNSIGVAEPSISREGSDRISVQLPGVSDPADAKTALSSTASLEYYMVDEQATQSGQKRFGVKFIQDEAGRKIGLKRKVIVTGANIVDASAGADSNGNMAVNVVLDADGAAKMGANTAANMGKPMAVVYIEQIPKKITLTDGSSKMVVEKSEKVISNATINGLFSKTFQTTGSFSQVEAQRLARTLRSGALVAPVYVIEERTVGPSAGKQNIAKGFKSIILGFALVMLFMLVYYKKFGAISVVALLLNVLLMLALLGLLGATLTLPGIAGVVLTMGMAVDANVLIFERIKEEVREGRNRHDAVSAGFDNAFSTITDANITTLIAAILLFAFGTGPIQGFAVTLIIGIITSMFTAIIVSRILIRFFFERGNHSASKLSI